MERSLSAIYRIRQPPTQNLIARFNSNLYSCDENTSYGIAAIKIPKDFETRGLSLNEKWRML